MNMLTVPVQFANKALFDEWTKRFEDRAEEICRSHDVMSLWDATKLWKDESKLEYAIVSMGAWPANSDHYRAQNKILGVWNEMFAENGFF